MSAAADFLAAIEAEPDDDTPRLVFADYLEEHGDPDRADFIRVQCELARLPSWDRRAKELRHRQRVHLARHGRRWYADLPALDGIKWERFERGFVAEVAARTPDVLVKNAAAIRAAAPVDSVRFDEWPGGAGPKAGAFPWVRRVGFVHRYDFDIADLEQLLDSPLAAHARVLDLTRLGVENPGAELVARAGHLTGLEELDLSGCFVGVAGVRALAGAKHLSNLRAIKFGSYGSGYVEDPFVSEEGVRLIAVAEVFANLRVVDLGGNQLTDAAVRELLTSKTLTNLEAVNLTHAELTPEAFAVPGGPSRLRDLDLSYTYEFGPAGLAAVAACPRLTELARLRVRGSGAADDGVAALAGSPAAGSLRELYLGGNEIGAEGAYHLAAADWPHLHTLDLNSNGIGAEGAKHLAESAGLAGLVELNLRGNKIGDAGAAALAGAAWGLRRLVLQAADLNRRGVAALAASPHLRGLTELNLAGNGLDAKGLAAVGGRDWPALTDLDLSENLVEDAGAAAVAPLLGRLVVLRLRGCEIGSRGVAALAVVAAPDLGELDLSGNKAIQDAGVKALAAADWPVLRSLELSYCGLTPPGVRALTGSPLFKGLRRLRTYGNQLPTSESRALMAVEHGDLGPDWVTEDVEDPAAGW